MGERTIPNILWKLGMVLPIVIFLWMLLHVAYDYIRFVMDGGYKSQLEILAEGGWEDLANRGFSEIKIGSQFFEGFLLAVVVILNTLVIDISYLMVSSGKSRLSFFLLRFAGVGMLVKGIIQIFKYGIQSLIDNANMSPEEYKIKALFGTAVDDTRPVVIGILLILGSMVLTFIAFIVVMLNAQTRKLECRRLVISWIAMPAMFSIFYFLRNVLPILGVVITIGIVIFSIIMALFLGGGLTEGVGGAVGASINQAKKPNPWKQQRERQIQLDNVNKRLASNAKAQRDLMAGHGGIGQRTSGVRSERESLLRQKAELEKKMGKK